MKKNLTKSILLALVLGLSMNTAVFAGDDDDDDGDAGGGGQNPPPTVASAIALNHDSTIAAGGVTVTAANGKWGAPDTTYIYADNVNVDANETGLLKLPTATVQFPTGLSTTGGDFDRDGKGFGDQRYHCEWQSDAKRRQNHPC